MLSYNLESSDLPSPSGCCTLVVVEETPPPPMIVKCFGCTAIHNKVLYKCIIHSFAFGCQGSLNSKYDGLQGLSGRCTYARHLRRWGMVYAPHVHQVLWPRFASHPWLFCSLSIAVPSHTRQGFASLAAWTARSPSFSDTARVPGGERPRLRMYAPTSRNARVMRHL